MSKCHSKREIIILVLWNKNLLGLFLSEPYYLYLPWLLGIMRRTRQSWKNFTPRVFLNHLNNMNETIATLYTRDFGCLCHYSLLNISDAKGKKSKVLSFTICTVFQPSSSSVSTFLQKFKLQDWIRDYSSAPRWNYIPNLDFAYIVLKLFNIKFNPVTRRGGVSA